MKIRILTITFLFAVKAFSQDTSFVTTTLNFDCDEIINYLQVKNNRLINFNKNESGFTTDFIFRLTCCAEYEIIGRYSGDSLFLNAKQTNDVSCDCICYYKATLQLPFINPELVYWDNEYIGTKQTEYVEHPVSYEIFEGDTINFIDKFKRAQGKFIFGEDKQNPRAKLTFENDSIISGWRILEYHKNNTPYILTTYNRHNVGDRSLYTYIDSNQRIITQCYRYYPRIFQYFEFCTAPSDELLNQLDSANMKYVTFISDSLILVSEGVLTVNYNIELRKLRSSKKTVYIILLDNGQYSKRFLSELEALKSENIEVFKKELLWL